MCLEVWDTKIEFDQTNIITHRDIAIDKPDLNPSRIRLLHSLEDRRKGTVARIAMPSDFNIEKIPTKIIATELTKRDGWFNTLIKVLRSR